MNSQLVQLQAMQFSRFRMYERKNILKLPNNLGNLKAPAQDISFSKKFYPAKYKDHLIPIKDFINFKQMSGNEILLNLDNERYMKATEVVGGLLELAKRDKYHSHNWNEHPTVLACL